MTKFLANTFAQIVAKLFSENFQEIALFSLETKVPRRLPSIISNFVTRGKLPGSIYARHRELLLTYLSLRISDNSKTYTTLQYTNCLNNDKEKRARKQQVDCYSVA